MSMPAAAAGLRARHVRDADAWHAADRRADRCDALFHGLGRLQQARDLPAAPANPRNTTLMFLGVLLLLQSGSPAVRPADPQTIDTVIVENRNIFDREDAAPDWVAHLANKLHMRTRQWVIRKRLLLNRGDPFDLARVEESERALRNLGVFRQVRVDTVRQADGKLALRAVTADGWSTQPQASFTSVGGDNTWEVGFIERNFLGTATELALIYGRNPDRSRLDLEFINPHFFSRRTLINARYSDLSDGHRGQWQFGLPFHETAAPHSVETYGELAHERVLRFRDAVLLDSTSHRLFRVGLMAGIAAAATTHKYARIWGGWEWRREDFGATDSSRVPYSVFTTVRAGVELGAVRFRVLEHFNSYARREDVDLSPTLRAGIVLQSGVGYEFSGQTSAVWKRGFAVVRVAPFLDYGGAWYRDEAARQGGDAGLSLRFGPTRAVRGEAVEVAFGYRFGQGVQGRRWAVTLRKGFSF